MQFKFCPHFQLNKQELEKIIDLKKRHWNYTSEEHINWIELNIKADDIHVLMYKKKKLVAYLNLIKTEVVINDMIQPFIGIGNVCSSEKGKGYGRKILVEVNNFLKGDKLNGILFCKDNLIDFYQKSNWVLVNKSLTDQIFFNYINVMILNFHSKIKSFKYMGTNF